MRKPLTARPACLRRGAVLFSIVVSSLAAFGGTATAAPGPTPDQGLTGACNMTNTNASFGMFTKAPQSGPGVNGMITAIDNTNGGTIPENCTGPS